MSSSCAIFKRTAAFAAWIVLAAAPAVRPAEAPPAEPNRAWTILIAGAGEQNSTKRIQAIAALGTMQGIPKAVDLVERGLADKDWSVRQAAVIALGELKSRSSIPKLEKALGDETPDVSFTAAKVLWDMGDRSARDMFLEILAGERSESPGLIKSSLRDAKSKLHNRTALALMGLKEGAGFALGPFSMGITVVEDLLKDNGAPARTLCAALLGSDTDPKTLPGLEEALTDKNWTVRVAVAKALGARGDGKCIPKLEARFEDDHDAVRYMAAASIVKLSVPPAKGKSRKPAKPASR